MKKKLRIIIARLGMDSHWRGSIVVARALRDAGMEVIYLGNQMPDAIVQTALQEDADVIGLSTLSGNHMVLTPEVIKRLEQAGLEDKVVILGGAIPPADVPKLKTLGVGEVFGSGSSLEHIIQYLCGMQ